MRKQLSNKQVQEVFDFTTKKYVLYYDVQLELVDHICLQVEELMDQEEGLSFEKALYQVYKSFGIYGFTKVLEEKVRQLMKYWTRRMWKYTLTYLSFPKIILTVLMSTLFFKFLSLISTQPFWIQLVGISALSFTPFIFMTIFSKKWKGGECLNGRKLLVIDALYQSVMSLLALAQLPFHFMLNIGIGGSSSNWTLALFSVLLGFIYILTHAVIYVFPNWLQSDLRKDYAHLLNKSGYASA